MMNEGLIIRARARFNDGLKLLHEAEYRQAHEAMAAELPATRAMLIRILADVERMLEKVKA